MNITQIEFNEAKTWRIIPSRYPPIDLFERVAEPEDLDAVIRLESMTNDRLRQEIGDINLVAPEDRVTGKGSGYIMAAFTHPNPAGSRFCDGLKGVYYGAFDLTTAIAETSYHRTLFLKATNEDPIHFDMRVLTAYITGSFHDIATARFSGDQIYDANYYRSSQAFAKSLQESESNGIHYFSVRKPTGLNIAVFKPRLIKNCTQAQHLEYVWDGAKISSIFHKQQLNV